MLLSEARRTRIDHSQDEDVALSSANSIQRQSDQLFECNTVLLVWNRQRHANRMSLHMVSKCPTEWRGKKVKQLCSLKTDKNVIYSIPFSSNGTIYRNAFCMFCNGVSIDHAVIWEPEYVCPNNHSYNPNVTEKITNCTLIFRPPLEERNQLSKSTCVPSIDTCDDPHDDLQTLCGSYMDLRYHYVSDNITMTYKNRHCVICNGVVLNETSCPAIVPRRESGFGASNLPPVRLSGIRLKLPNFARLLDLSASDIEPHPTDFYDVTAHRGQSANITQILAGRHVTVVVTVTGDRSSHQSLQNWIRRHFITKTNISELNFRNECSLNNSNFYDTLNPVPYSSYFHTHNASCSQVISHDATISGLYLVKHMIEMIDSFNDIHMKGDVNISIFNFDSEPLIKCERGALVNYNDSISLTYAQLTGKTSLPSVPYAYINIPFKHTVMYNNASDIFTIDFAAKLCEHVLSNCTLILLSKQEYQHQKDDRVYIPTYDSLIDAGDFEYMNDGILVCYDSLQGLLARHGADETIEAIVSLVCTSLSLIGLSITLITYITFPTLRTVPGKLLMGLVASLLISQITFQTSSLPVAVPVLCVAHAALQHFAWLSAFCWMSALAFDICRTFSSLSTMLDNYTKRFVWYTIYALTIPMLFVIPCIILTEVSTSGLGYEGAVMCWFNMSSNLSVLMFFALPIAIILIANATMFVICLLRIHRMNDFAKRKTTQHNRNEAMIYVRLSSVMGFTWVFGFISAFTNIDVFRYIFIILNAGQGAFVFLSFVIQPNVLRLFRNMFRVDESVTSHVTQSMTNLDATRGTQHSGASIIPTD